MFLKNVVDGILKEKNRPMSWLADEMDKTFDGLKLGLVRGSIKYNDLIAMAMILKVSPSVFFESEPAPYKNQKGNETLADTKEEYNDLKSSLKNCKEMLSALKDQLKDKEKIISLLSK
ncbi:hypothetical protein [Pedobacter frigoris]|uniref:hypothetical protein n=1 Tax=Pedobacter frigoris TaxID=2571272 RepID=UPI002930A91D|nr:hypothetical protein [Pedobacter frigoris]